MSGDEVDEVSVCRSIMVRTNSSYLLQLGLTQQKRRLTGLQYSLLHLTSTPVDDTGKVSSPVSCPKNTILTPLIAGTPFRSFLPHQPQTYHIPRHAPIPNHPRRLHINCTQIERKRRVCCG